MSRKPKKGYFVRGQFVAEGSDLDRQLKAELKGTTGATKTDLKRESDALQALGAELVTLRADLFARLALPDKLQEALVEAAREDDAPAAAAGAGSFETSEGLRCTNTSTCARTATSSGRP